VKQVTQGLAKGHPESDRLVRQRERLLPSWASDLRPATATVRDAHDLRSATTAHHGTQADGHADNDAHDLRSAATAAVRDTHDLRSTAAAVRCAAPVLSDP
jgi:hypothetical protein